MRAIKVFISQPMANKTNEEIEAERNAIIATLKSRYVCAFEILDSFFKDCPHDATPLFYLGKSFEILSKADVCVFAPGWENARGCIMEHMACQKYAITIIDDITL